MAEEAPAVAPAKPAKKKAAPRPKKDGPTLPKLVLGVVAESKERKGMSLLALKKVLDTKGVDVSKSNKRINSTVTRLVAGGSLVRTKGSGASGSFRLAKKEPKAAVKPAKKVVQKAAAKAKKPTAKKPAAKKPAAKKSPKKAPAKKAVKKPVPIKSPKKAAPKKAVKKPAKKTPVKKAPAKKVAAKKSKK